MNGRLETVTYEQQSIAFELRLLERTTTEIAVHPNKTVVVKAPIESRPEAIFGIVQKRAGWIMRQIQHFEQLEPRTPPRRYVNGESHLYLGRQYRLNIQQAGTGLVVLKNGCFHVHAPSCSPDTVRRLLDEWYGQKAHSCFGVVFERCWEQFKHHNVARPSQIIRKMKTRWGSLSPRNVMTLNVELIKAPKACVEYVVMHELCHLVHRNHGAAFYRLLDRSLPDWAHRKRRLEMALA